MDNEEHNLSPDATTSEPEELTSETESAKREVKKRSIFVVGLGVLCLAFVFLFVYLALNMSSDDEVPPPAEPEQPMDTEEPEETLEEKSNVDGRDPDVLGLRIDTMLGRFFVLPDSGQTLYVTASECTGDCLDIWTPYTAEEAISESGPLGTVGRSDGGLQYTWNGKALYTYNKDDNRSVLGDGYEGKWNIARP